jgi:hypothetical protein
MNDFTYTTGFGVAAFLIFFLIALIPAIFFFLAQQNTLKVIKPANRFMAPGEVWLQLIPLFGMVWQFFVITRISNSIARELSDRNTFSFEQQDTVQQLPNERPTYNIGMAYAILACLSLVPLLATLTALAAIICWIIYWVKLSEYKRKIEVMHNEADYRG